MESIIKNIAILLMVNTPFSFSFATSRALEDSFLVMPSLDKVDSLNLI